MVDLPDALLEKLATLRQRRRTPGSTYRLQLHKDFGFQAASAQVEYLSQLGLTDIYVSPILKAKPGSQHGYDICDHHELNPELGSVAAFDAFSQKLQQHHLGLLVDFVPNHMGVDPNTNPWWRDVLENGLSSAYAHFFDIDWDPQKPELKGKVLLPILGDLYGRVLERGELRLVFEDGAFWIRYFETRLPVHRREGLPSEDAAAIEAFNGTVGDSKSFDRLHALLEAQFYRLAFWKTALDEINYRRFFDINTLAGLRMEEPLVFQKTHALTLKMLAEGQITGLRLDHPDGLFDPSGYYETVQQAFLRAWLQHELPHLEWTAPMDEALHDWRVAERKNDPTGLAAKPLYLAAEKILTGDELLSPIWMIDGTTGYDFLNDLTRLWIPATAIPAMKSVLERFVGRHGVFSDILYDSKKLIMSTSMSSELQVLAQTLNRISEADRNSRDYTLDNLRRALREIVACFPVYRTYITMSHASAMDRTIIEKAVSEAIARNPAIEPSIFEFIRGVLIPENAEKVPLKEFRRQTALTMKVQQYTAPVQAKGMEDTAFYRYAPLMALNEVGGEADPAVFDIDSFHKANAHRQSAWPHTMLASSTHDTKRGEDARARLAVLAKIPDEWERQVTEWARLATPFRKHFGALPAPSPYDEYSFYQSLLGAWSAHPGEESRSALADRMSAYMLKMIRESKVHTSWISPNEAYEEAVEYFVRQLLEGENAEVFYAAFVPFAKRIAQAGVLNSLSQVAIKCAAPGVPDFYQGNELWNLDLVDPDNRRAVDYGRRQKGLSELLPFLEKPDRDRHGVLREWMQTWSDARIKQFVTAASLRFRREHAALFMEGDYHPILAKGAAADHIVAFGRAFQGEAFVVVTPRWLAASLSDSLWPDGFARQIFRETTLDLPATFQGSFQNVYTGDSVTTQQTNGRPTFDVAMVLEHFPIAFLSR